MTWQVDDTITATGPNIDQWRELTPGIASGVQQLAVSVEPSESLGLGVNACGFVAMVYPDFPYKVVLRSRIIPFLPPRNLNNLYLLQTPPQTRPGHLAGLPNILVSVPQWFPATVIRYWAYRV